MKLGKLALAGALALGGFTGLAALDAKPASAAEKTVQYANPYDPWGIDDTWTLQYIDPMPAEYKEHLIPSYQTLNWITVVRPWSSSLKLGTDQVKIFRIDEKGDLSRYKTIDFVERYDYQLGKPIAVWQTQITDNYHPGNYIAISYINGKHLKSDIFTINK
ncbi:MULTISPECIES: DUF5065 family protein [Bacillus]|uniref:DUF5065 domain-containing protein n=1 Tax=Bacillus wiedmannii TaxID=1890302 RepID=A0ABX5DNL3_9BACI|nr:DUF5065 family protein [Bacillus wiedmannii]PRT01304.1 DUF5065 domain-containing protein [Bacillus wiedmannii]PRT35400.1 DUF5065 domain-containing protein [Bacillus wiedmannii]